MITLSYEVMESSVECITNLGGRSANVGGYGVQAAHRQRFNLKRNAVPAQCGIGWCRLAAAEFVGVAVRLSGLNCVHQCAGDQ